MTNEEKIRQAFVSLKARVEKGTAEALCEQMVRTLNTSLNLHQTLEAGSHTHHLSESDSHGYAVAVKGLVVESGGSMLSEPNEHGSAARAAESEATRNNPGFKGVFTAVMANPFEGGAGARDGEPLDPDAPPHDSMRFEEKLHEMLRLEASVEFPIFMRREIQSAKSNG